MVRIMVKYLIPFDTQVLYKFTLLYKLRRVIVIYYQVPRRHFNTIQSNNNNFEIKCPSAHCSSMYYACVYSV